VEEARASWRAGFQWKKNKRNVNKNGLSDALAHPFLIDCQAIILILAQKALLQ
jgi:hypothetical protein